MFNFLGLLFYCDCSESNMLHRHISPGEVFQFKEWVIKCFCRGKNRAE